MTFVKRAEVTQPPWCLSSSCGQAAVLWKSKECLEISAMIGCDLDTTGGTETHSPASQGISFFSDGFEHVPLLYFDISHR